MRLVKGVCYIMKVLLFVVAAFLGLAAFVSDANAYVCARGWRGAACAGPRGAVGVARPYGYYGGYRRPYGYGVYRGGVYRRGYYGRRW